MSKPNFVSLFSGIGGLDLGLEAAGWHCSYAADNDPAAIETMLHNRGRGSSLGSSLADAFVEVADVTRLDAVKINAKAGLRRGDVSLLAGGPPCQSWSSAGHQLGFSDARGRLFDDFVRIAQETDARWLLIENVRGLLTARGPDGVPGSALTLIRHKLLAAGYQTDVCLLNAADYGLPQRRVRLFIVGFHSGDAPRFPEPTHSKVGGSGLLPWVTLGEALSRSTGQAELEIIRPNEKLAAELGQLVPGKGLRSAGKSERTRPGGHWGYRQGCFLADLNQSARTVTANAQQDWIVDPEHGIRRLTPRECAILQGFPAEWEFLGRRQVQYRHIGNAVPPPLAAKMGEALLQAPHSNHPVQGEELIPLPPRLQYHINYTAREEASNGASRRMAPARRKLLVS